MGDIKNCKKCGKTYYSNDSRDAFCRNCSEDEKRIYKEIKEYLYNNPGASAYELSFVFNMSIDRITRYIEDGKLSLL